MVEALTNALTRIGALFSGVATPLLVGLIIFVLGITLGKLLEKLALSILKKIELNASIRKAAGIRLQLEESIAYALKYLTYIITILFVLNKLGFSAFIANIVAATLIVVIFASVLLSIKDFFPNFVAGMAIYRKGIIHVGDHITYRNINGVVSHAGLLEVKVMTPKGDELYIPTSMLIKAEFFVKHKPGKTSH